ncbi:type I-E CRISPR-associated protein Cse2/CasB [Parasaccharibacter apium]|uniref:type I-E CRISPR-associated protein Cse2/CasB n=1 Tax=Parasaccharibacter apium TaxID=1510841 RepID=UPI0009DDE078|nr:type I-E CRISPR-associated protein Cse2/CasB [Parasaccharibacter apium]
MIGYDEVGEIVQAWWKKELSPAVQEEEKERKRGQTEARALGAKLRYGQYPAILFVAEVQDLRRNLEITEPHIIRFSQLLNVLGEIRRYDGKSLPRLLRREEGSDKQSMSEGRFEQLITSDGEEFIRNLRRAVSISNNKCNIKTLSSDIMYWNDDIRARWYCDYFGSGVSGKK